MSYIGQGLPADTFQGFTTDKFTGDGTANKAFTLTKEPFSEDTILVTIDGVVQEPTDDFTVSGTTLTLVGTAPNNSEVNVTRFRISVNLISRKHPSRCSRQAVISALNLRLSRQRLAAL